MGSALVGIDVVHETVRRFSIAVVVLKGSLEKIEGLLAADDIDGLGKDGGLVRAEMGDEGGDPAGTLELLLLLIALVDDLHADALVEKRKVAQPMEEYVVGEFYRFKNIDVGKEPHLRPCLFRFAYDLQLGHLLAALISLEIDLPTPPYLDLEVLGKGVDHGQADAVKTGGDICTNPCRIFRPRAIL